MLAIHEPRGRAVVADDPRGRHLRELRLRAGGGRQAAADVVLEVPERERSDEIGRELGRRQPGAVVLGPGLRLLLEGAVDHQRERLVLGHARGVDADVDQRVDHAPQVVLPMRQHQGRIVGAVPGIHHHLGHVDGPTLGEDAASEQRPGDRRAAIRVDALEVVAGHRLMDRQQAEHPGVVLPERRFCLLGGPVIGDRRDREDRLLAALQGAR